MRDKTGGVAIEESVRLKPKMYSFLLGNSQHKKEGVNKNVVATITHNEYKDVLFNNNCIRHWMIRIQSKDHITGTYEVKKTSVSRFDDKYILKTISMID